MAKPPPETSASANLGAKPQGKTSGPKGVKVRKTQQAAIEAFNKVRPDDSVTYCAFAGVLKGGHAYELWYYDDEWCTAFVVLYADGSDEFYESVQELIQDINLARQLEQETFSLAADRRIRLWVGAAAFLGALAVVLGMAMLNPGQGALVAAVISVLASGCVAIFGVWIPTPFNAAHHHTKRTAAATTEVT